MLSSKSIAKFSISIFILIIQLHYFSKAENPDSTDYHIYSIVIDDVKIAFDRPVNSVNEKAFDTNFYGILDFVRIFKMKKMNEVSISLKNEFLKKNKTSVFLENKFNTLKNTEIITEEEFKICMGEREYLEYDNFYKRHPNSNGIITFSRIAYNIKKTMALVLVGYQYAGLSGYGYFVLLKKINDKWIITKEIHIWIS